MEPVPNPLRVVLADDHHFFREGLRGMLEADGIEVVGEAADAEAAVELACALLPDAVVIDLNMPDPTGIPAIRQIAATAPEIQVIALSVSANERDALDALSAGACGYLLKDTRVEELVASIRLAACGHAVLSRQIVRALAAKAGSGDRAAERAAAGGLDLSARELQVIRLICEGADNATIGRELSISRHTAKQHVTNILTKLGVDSRVQAAVYAVRTGLIETQ
jgi:DNA-binding NarL/FixJ family response regulator